MPLRYRHIGFSLSVSCQWLAAFLTVFAGPIAIADTRVGWKTWIWFLVFNALAIPYGKTRPSPTVPLSFQTSFLFPPEGSYTVLTENTVYFFCPETRGHSLEQIDLLFISDHLRGTESAMVLKHEDGHVAVDNVTVDATAKGSLNYDSAPSNEEKMPPV